MTSEDLSGLETLLIAISSMFAIIMFFVLTALWSINDSIENLKDEDDETK